MPKKKFRSPQEKKVLSYAKDRRNTHGENDKASRKLIPLRKAAEHRRGRRKTSQEVTSLARLDELAAEVLESSVRHDTHRVGGWTKGADDPLGKVVRSSLQRRRISYGRKEPSRTEQESRRDTRQLDCGVLVGDDPEILMRQARRLRRIAKMIIRMNKSKKEACGGDEFAQRFMRSAIAYEERAGEIMVQRRCGGQ